MIEKEIRWNLWPKQLYALRTSATEVLFGGASSGGKSHFVRIALCTWCLSIPGLQCVLIRKKFADIESNHVEGRSGFRALLQAIVDAGEANITQDGVWFKNGSNIFFQHCQDERQFDSAQGVERHVLVVDEATQISERLLRFFRTWCRMDLEMQASLPDQWKGKFPRIIYTANPIGTSVGFFRRNFVKAREPLEIERVQGFLRQYIPSRVEDNLSADLEAFEGRMEGIGDAAIATALREGDWDAPTGDFYPEWNEDRHVIPDFTPPEHWYRFAVHDWGTRDPALFRWYAVSPGELVGFPGFDERGEPYKARYIPRGCLVAYREWYICADDDQSQGRRMRNEDMRDGFLDRTEVKFRRQPVLSDNLPFQDRGGETIAQIYENKGQGINLIQGDTSRIPGWAQLRSRLIGIQPDTNNPFRYAMMLWVKSCKASRDYMPALPRHPSESKREDAAESGEATHSCDVDRLAAMAHKVIRDAPQSSAESIRAANVQVRRAVKQKQTLKSIITSNGGRNPFQ